MNIWVFLLILILLDNGLDWLAITILFLMLIG